MDSGNREAGQQAFFFGELMELRLRLGLSKTALSEILGVSTMSLYRWEGFGPLSKLNNTNAEKVDLFCRAARQVLEDIPDFRERYMTFAIAAQRMGVPNEVLFAAYRSGAFQAEDFGMLGLFVQRNRQQAWPKIR